MEDHTWIAEVLEDLKKYALENDLTAFQQSISVLSKELRSGADSQAIFPQEKLPGAYPEFDASQGAESAVPTQVVYGNFPAVR